MKNFKAALLAAAVTASVVNSDVNADCLGSGIQIGVGFKASKSKFEIQNNKVKPYNERLKELGTSKLAPLQARHDEVYGPLYDMSGSIVGSEVSIDENEKITLSGYQVGEDGVNLNGPGDITKATRRVKYKNTHLYTLHSGKIVDNSGTGYNIGGLPGDYEDAEGSQGESMLPLSAGGSNNYTKTNGGDSGNGCLIYRHETMGPMLGAVDPVTSNLLKESYSYKLGDIARYFLADWNSFAADRSAVAYAEIDEYYAELGVDNDQRTIINTIFQGPSTWIAGISSECPNGGFVSLKNNFVKSVIDTFCGKVDNSHMAFAKSGIGQNYEKADHWDGAFDITLGWHQRFGDFALYFGGIAEIPCFKKEYQIKDKALASLKSNTSNGDNNNKSSSDENNEYGYTFKKTPSFAVSIMGFYNVTKMCSIGAGVNIWKQRGELNYNKTGELYLLSESSSDVNYVKVLGKTLDEFNAEAKKAGYDKKTEKVSAWMFEPTVAVNFNWGNFMMSLRGGYKIGKKFIKAGDGKFDLKGSGFNIGVNLSYTIPVI